MDSHILSFTTHNIRASRWGVASSNDTEVVCGGSAVEAEPRFFAAQECATVPPACASVTTGETRCATFTLHGALGESCQLKETLNKASRVILASLCEWCVQGRVGILPADLGVPPRSSNARLTHRSGRRILPHSRGARQDARHGRRDAYPTPHPSLARMTKNHSERSFPLPILLLPLPPLLDRLPTSPLPAPTIFSVSAKHSSRTANTSSCHSATFSRRHTMFSPCANTFSGRPNTSPSRAKTFRRPPKTFSQLQKLSIHPKNTKPNQNHGI